MKEEIITIVVVCLALLAILKVYRNMIKEVEKLEGVVYKFLTAKSTETFVEYGKFMTKDQIEQIEEGNMIYVHIQTIVDLSERLHKGNITICELVDLIKRQSELNKEENNV